MFFRHCNGNKKSNHDNGDFSGRFYFRGCIYKQGVFFRPDKSLLCLFPMIQIPMIYGKTFSSDDYQMALIWLKTEYVLAALYFLLDDNMKFE